MHKLMKLFATIAAIILIATSYAQPDTVKNTVTADTIMHTMTNATEIAPNTEIANQTVEMATGMRSNGKIYVVVAVLSVVLFILFAYLIRLERKLKNMEKAD
jgi:hypothetical protein